MRAIYSPEFSKLMIKTPDVFQCKPGAQLSDFVWWTDQPRESQGKNQYSNDKLPTLKSFVSVSPLTIRRSFVLSFSY